VILVLYQSPNSTVFSIVWFPGGAKTELSGDSLTKMECTLTRKPNYRWCHKSVKYVTKWGLLRKLSMGVLGTKRRQDMLLTKTCRYEKWVNFKLSKDYLTLIVLNKKSHHLPHSGNVVFLILDWNIDNSTWLQFWKWGGKK